MEDQPLSARINGCCGWMFFIFMVRIVFIGFRDDDYLVQYSTAAI